MKEDAARKDTEEVLETAEERVKQAEEDKENHEMVDIARAHMKAAIEGGLQLDADKMTLDSAFDEIQREMKDKFTTRLNTKEQNEQLTILMQGKRIYETFEIAPNNFTIKFQSFNSDENAFIGQVTLVNGPALRSGTEDKARHDNGMRTELLMALTVMAINTKSFEPIDIDKLYETVEKEGDEETKVISVGDKIRELLKRLVEIRKILPFGTYSTAITAMGAWTEYLQDLVSPKRIGNFSTPPSEHS